MKKISLKIGLFFFIAVCILETISMFFLHNNIIHSRVHDELSALLTRGNNHREILEASYHPETIKHIALMESQTDTQVILTDLKGNISMSSNKVTPEMKQIIRLTPKYIPHEGMILEDDWQHESYIATISPVNVNHANYGYVYMFQTTQKLKDLISGLNRHFMLAGLLSLLFMFIMIFFLTRFVTQPLIQMNEATKRISKGDFSVSLPKLGRDELGELGESIRVLATDLELLKNERNEFLASISHELRTPLTYIKGYAEIARRSETMEDDRNHYLDIILEESTKLAKLVKELFHLARMDENNFSIEKQSVHLYPYFLSIYNKILPAFRDRQIELTYDCTVNLYAELDPIRFEQVILNLLDNARKYSEPTSKVRFVVREVEQKIVISIEDNGKGIPPEDIPRIFERFYRVDKSRTRALGGSGLGLSIVKELVEAHGGTIEVYSILGEGTMFEIKL
ncbi:MAG: HAMP domain-containing sensor histidine kinase [Bacillota bacterium]|nr:HAMP domain-containing sensor histidine kinase [Bacillota bacterium]